MAISPSTARPSAHLPRGPLHETAPVSNRTKRFLTTIRGLDLNFDPERRQEYLDAGWYHDHHETVLGREAPGAPYSDGVFARAKSAVQGYRHVDPAIVRAVWRADSELVGRHMALEGRFYGMRFQMGLKVGGVLDTTGEVDGRLATRWGWNYRTLEGHLERGQMNFEVRKYHDDGTVHFIIDAYNSRAPIRNPVTALGMAVFGRFMQGRFGRRALRRMEQFAQGIDPDRADTTFIDGRSIRDVDDRPGNVLTLEEHAAKRAVVAA